MAAGKMDLIMACRVVITLTPAYFMPQHLAANDNEVHRASGLRVLHCFKGLVMAPIASVDAARERNDGPER